MNQSPEDRRIQKKKSVVFRERLKYFMKNAKDLLDKGVKIEGVKGSKVLFSISPADGSYKVNFGEEEFENYFKDFLRPQLVQMLF